ncbi:LCP family protein [Cytobacillus sp. IB215665]|uniref:LCP family protein n=1 Tax=Cytobacillus sp. IB215665 TaxID=3097357 RepID=UPI002A1292D4|nr:LCP family protein [Cytobacillus sp. IB215665]MDX8363807.1 LCP family protein [Cytobacillus sp. IB215665]
MNNDRRYLKLKHRKKKRRRIIYLFTIPLLVIILGVSTYGSILLNQAQSAANEANEELVRGEKSEKREEVVHPKADNISILFMGVDDSEARGSGNSRTDALLLATFNEEEKSVKLLSIPRDSYVYIPSVGYNDKINHAHAFGGTDGAVETVENLLDIPVDYFVKLNFNAFVDLVDALDGIEVDVPITFSEQDSQDRKGAIYLEQGLQTLNGEEALALARTRKIDSDLKRGERQQLVMKAIAEKAASLGSVTKYSAIIEALGNNIKTNLTFDEMISFYDYATSSFTIDNLQLQGSNAMIDGIYYYDLDDQQLENIKQELKTHLNVNADNTTNDSVVNNEQQSSDNN